MTDGDISHLTVRLGVRLRTRRTELGMTLAAVSQAADVSSSHLSMIEGGRSAPSLPVLARIGEALNMSLSEILGAEDDHRVRKTSLDPDSVGSRPVSHPELELTVEVLNARANSDGRAPVAHTDHDVLVYVRSGALTVTVDGGPYALLTGDSLNVVGARSIRWSAGDDPCVSLWASAARVDDSP